MTKKTKWLFLSGTRCIIICQPLKYTVERHSSKPMTVEYRLETVYDVNVLNCYIGLVMKLVQKLRLWNFMFSLFLPRCVRLPETGVHCDHTEHFSADLSLWLDSPMFWHPDTKACPRPFEFHLKEKGVICQKVKDRLSY